MLTTKSESLELTNKKILSADQIALIKRTICRDATDDELSLFLMICEKTQLDPFSRQIYAVHRWNADQKRMVMTFQTSIDGFRVTAERSKQYAGQLGPYWCGDDGVWKDVWLEDSPPRAAKVGVIRTDFKEPLFSVAKFKSFVQTKKDGTPNKFWREMPEQMIAKVAEAQAIRRAFPNDLSGLYIEDEIQPAIEIETSEKPIPIAKTEEIYTGSSSQKKLLFQILTDLKIEDVGVMAEINRRLIEEKVIFSEDGLKRFLEVHLKS